MAGTVLDVWFPAPRLGPQEGPAGTEQIGTLELGGALGPDYSGLVRTGRARGVRVIPVRTTIPDLSAPPAAPSDVYLRLHLLSHCVIRPRSANLDGAFTNLTNVGRT